MRLPTLLAASVLFPSAAAAQDWTRFRGPNGTGISPSKSAPIKWSEKDFRWRAQLPGEGHSQPVIWGERVFLECAEEKGKNRILVCLGKQDGKELWAKKYAMSTHRKHNLNSYASSTPAVDKERIYAIFATPQEFLVKAWDHSGRELWSVNLGAFNYQHGQGASPILFEDKLIVPNDQTGDSFIAALDVKTGKTVWKCPRRSTAEQAAYGTPCILDRSGSPTELLTTCFEYGISSLDPRTGAINWEAHVFDKRSVSSPVVAGDLVIGTCGSGGGGNYLAAVRLGGKGDVTSTHQAYTVREAAPYVPTPIAAGEMIYLTSDKGIASALDAKSGRVLWSERVGGDFMASPVMIGGRIFANSVKGDTCVFEVSDRFKLVAKNPLGEGSYTTPCVDGDRLYMRTFGHLVCVGK